MTLGELIDSKMSRRPKSLDIASVLVNNVFEFLQGKEASAVTIDSTFTIFVREDKYEYEDQVNF